MLVQQLQRPTRLVAALVLVCLVYLSFSYLQTSDFASCSAAALRNAANSAYPEYAGKFGASQPLTTRPKMAPSRPTSRIAKVSVAVNALDIPVVHRAFESHRVHNEMHGYLHYVADQEVVSSLTDNDALNRGSGAYTKPAYLLAIVIAELLKPEAERLEWLFWFDGDTIILNPSTPLETFLPPANTSDLLSDIHLVISSNWDGLNSGAFALRVNKWAASFLSGVLAYPMYQFERTKKDRFRDQSAFQYILTDRHSPLWRDRYHHKNHWADVPMRWFNSLPVNNAFYSDGRWIFAKNMTDAQFDNGTTDVFDDGFGPKVNAWKVMQGDLMLHFAGTKHVRDSWMGPWLDRSEKLLPQWNNATYSAQLAVEVAAWWRDYEDQSRAELAELDREDKARQDKAKADKERADRERVDRERAGIEKAKEEKQKAEAEADRAAAAALAAQTSQTASNASTAATSAA